MTRAGLKVVVTSDFGSHAVMLFNMVLVLSESLYPWRKSVVRRESQLDYLLFQNSMCRFPKSDYATRTSLGGGAHKGKSDPLIWEGEIRKGQDKKR